MRKITIICFFIFPILLFSQKNFNVGKVYIISEPSGLKEILNQHKNVLIKVSSSPKMAFDKKSKRIYNSYDAIIVTKNNKSIMDFLNFEFSSKLIYDLDYLISVRFSSLENKKFVDIIEIFDSSSTSWSTILEDFCYSSYDPFDSFLSLNTTSRSNNNVNFLSDGKISISIDKIKICDISCSNNLSSTYFKIDNLLDERYFEMIEEINLLFNNSDLSSVKTIKLSKKEINKSHLITSEKVGYLPKTHMELGNFKIVFNYNSKIFEFTYSFPFMKDYDYYDYIEENNSLKQRRLEFIEENSNIWNFDDLDHDNIDDNFDNCKGISNTYQDDLDMDGIGDECDCNFANPDPLASKDTDSDGVCDDKDKCPYEFGELKNNGCPEGDLLFTTGTEKIENKKDTIGEPFIYNEAGIFITTTKKIESKSVYNNLVKDIRLVSQTYGIDSVNASIMYFDDIYENIQNQEKESINHKKVNSIQRSLDKHKSQIPSNYILRLDSIQQILKIHGNKTFQIESDSKILDDCLSLLPLYLDSVASNPKDTLYNSIIIEMLDAMKQVLSAESNTIDSKILNDKMLISVAFFDYITNSTIKGYLFPSVCYETKERKKYSKNAKAYYYNGQYGKRHDLKHFFQFGVNPHYELFAVGNYFISYVINDTINLPDYFELKTVKDPLNYTSYFHEQTKNASQDQIGWKAVVILDFLDEKIMDKSKPMPGLTQYDESKLINALDEINRKQNKYFLVKGKIFYEHEK